MEETTSNKLALPKLHYNNYNTYNYYKLHYNHNYKLMKLLQLFLIDGVPQKFMMQFLLCKI